MKVFATAALNDINITLTPIASAKQNDCYSGREGFLYAGISENKLCYCHNSGVLEQDMLNLHIQGSLSMIGAKNF
jgi:hypothetical protein